MAMNTKPRLHQSARIQPHCRRSDRGCASAHDRESPKAHRLVRRVVHRPNMASAVFFPVHAHVLPTGKVMIWPGDAGIIRPTSSHDPGIPPILA